MRPSRWWHLRYLALGLLTGVMLFIPKDAVAQSEPDPVTCEGYAEKRVYLENQSWVTPQPGDPAHPGAGETGHIHMATCFPLHQDVTSDVLRLDIRLQLHNVPGTATWLIARTYQVGGGSGQMIQYVVPPCEVADCSQWVRVDFPLAEVEESGWNNFQILLNVNMVDGREWYNVNRWYFNLVNGAPPRASEVGSIRIGGDSWLDSAGTDYAEAEIVTEDFPWDFTTGEFIPVAGIWEPTVRFKRDGPNRALIDPALHAVPTDFGLVVYDGSGSGFRTLSIDTTQLSNGPHKLLLSSCNQTPEGFENCGVLVVPFRVHNPQGPDEVGLVDPASGEWRLRSESGLTTQFFYGNPGDTPFMGDWDCDGVETPGLFRTSDAFAYMRNSNTQGIADVRFFFGNPSDIPLAGDFNGDGCDTLSIYRPSEQRFYIINALGANNGGLGAAEYSFLFGNPGDKPFVGDFDGDGIDEVGLHRESTGFVYYRNTLTTGNADNQFFFGDPGDRFIAGDWNDDGIDSPAVFRPANSTFYFRYSNSQGVADETRTWGGTTWLPVAG